MTGLLTDPTCVIVVGDEATADDVESAVCEGRAKSVVDVATADRAIAVLTERDDVGCVVVTDDGGDVEAAVESIREHGELYPIVARVEDGSEDLAHRLTRAGALEYVPAPVADDTLRTIVDDAIDRCDEMRWQAADSDMLLALMEAFDGAMYAKDTEGRHFRKVSVPGDYNPEEFVGKTDVDVYGEREREALEDDRRVAETGESIEDKECRFETPDGYRWSRSTKVPWRDENGEIRGLVGITRDVTEEVERRRRLERHQEQLERVAKSFTHDLRTPLQIASGYLEMARKTGDDDAFDEADRALRRMDDMLEDLAGIAPGRSKEATPGSEGGVESTSLPALIEDVWSVGWSDAAALESRFPDGAVATAPERCLRPVFENLLKNSVEHATEDPLVRVGPLPEGGFFVEDDGPGIPEGEREDVLEQGYTTSADGSGLGLAIVNDVAERYDWTIGIAESESGGARFEIRNCPVVPEPDRGFEPESSLELEASADVGSVAVEGEVVERDEDRVVVESGGQNIYGQVNEFHFVRAAVEGPVRLQARVETLETVTEWSTAGLMVRQDLAEDAAYGYVGATETHGTGLLWRHERGGHGGSYHFEEPTTFPWYRIERDGERVTVAVSEDGTEWTPVDQRRIDLSEPCYVGLAVCSNKSGECARAAFEDVSVTALEPSDG